MTETKKPILGALARQTPKEPISPADAALAALLELGPVRVSPLNKAGNYDATLTFGHNSKVKAFGPTPMLALKALHDKVITRAQRVQPMTGSPE